MTEATCEIRKRSYRFPGFVRDLAANARSLPGLLSAYLVPGRLDPALREKVMLGVTRVNQCRHCAAIHGLWGEQAGVSPADQDALTQGDTAHFADDEWAAIELACAAATGVGALAPAEATRELRRRFGPRRARELLAAARAINLANRLGNTWDVFGERLRGRPAADSALAHELLVLATVAPVGAPFLVVSKGVRSWRGEPEL